jgi:ferredoxin
VYAGVALLSPSTIAKRLGLSRAGALYDGCMDQGGYGMKIRIDKAACAGNARCAAAAPELFPLDENGYIAVAEINVLPGQEELARLGASVCPERIILIEED